MKDSRFKKYEFSDKDEANLKISEIQNNEVNLAYGIVHLGFLTIVEGEYDENGNETKAPILSNKYSVDVFWRDAEPEGWKGKKIKLNGAKSSHTFAGIEYEDD